MTKLLKIIKTLQESLIQNRPSKNFQQLSKHLLPSDVEGDLLPKRYNHRKNTVKKLQRSIWCLGSNLERSFLFEIPPTLTIARGFSSRYMIPPKMMSKMGSNKTSEVDRLTIIPAWMKKPKIKKFQDNIGNVKNKNRSIPQNKNLHEFNVAEPKFKLTSLINKKSKTMQSMTESLKPKKFFNTVMNKITLPQFETKRLVLKKKNNKKESLNFQNGLEDSIKEVINANIPANYKLTISIGNKPDHERNKQAAGYTSECVRKSSKPLMTMENNVEKSLVVVPEKKPMQPNKNDDRSRIRRHKTKNFIVEKDEKLLKLKAKNFEKPEVDMYIKKLAAKYGKTVVSKSAKPKRIYENNRQRIKYDLDTDKYAGEAGIMTKRVISRKIETKISHYSKQKLNEFMKKDIENRRILKKGNNLLVNQRTTSHKIEAKPKGSTILKKENLTADKKLQTGAEFVNKKANSAIKLNSKNGFLKDRDKHIMSAENRKIKLETQGSSNSANVNDDGKGKECTNEPEIKSTTCCQNEKKKLKDQMVPCIPKIIGNSLIIISDPNPNSNKLQKELTPSTDENYLPPINAKKITECIKTDDKSQILSSNQNNNKNKLMNSDTLSNKTNENHSKIENMARESKNKQTKDESTGTVEDQSTNPAENKNKSRGQHLSSNTDTSSKPIEQMKYMKYTPDSTNYICSPKQKIESCKYKMSRGVHSDKPDISRESKRHLRNAQPNFKLNNKTSLIHRSDKKKKKSKEATEININKNLPSNVEIIKTMDKKLSVPMKIYKFPCHTESFDYKVYSYDSSHSISSETKQSNTIEPNVSDMETGNLEQINTFKKRGYKCFERQNNSKNDKLSNVNTIRIRFPPIVNFKNDELTTKEMAPITAKQSSNHSVRPTKGENLPSIVYRVLDTEDQTFDSENQSKYNYETFRQMKKNKVMHLEEVKDERNPEGKENMNVNIKNLHLSNIISDKEKSNCADTKTLETISLKKQIKGDVMARYEAEERDGCVNDNKLFIPRVSREMYKPKGYIDYSRRELKKILPFLKELSNKTINIYSKEDRNLESIENKKQADKEIDDLKASVADNLRFEIQENKQLEEMQSGNQVESNSPSSHQLSEISLQRGIMKRKIWNKNNNIKKDIFPSFDIENKTGMNVLYYKDTAYKPEKELGVQHPTMITGMQTIQHKMQPNQTTTSWMDKFHELVINKPILNNKVKNIFLMHGFNKVSFLKVFEDNHHITSGKNIFPKHIPTVAINNTNVNEGEHSKNKINELQVLENDLKTMLYQQLELYNRKIKHKYPETIKQNDNIKIYDLYDCTFILQDFNKVSLNCKPPKNIAEENLYQSSTSLNDFEFINGGTEKKYDKTVQMQKETNKDFSDMIKRIKTCGRLILQQNPKDVSFIEVLDCQIPKKGTKSMVKESSTDDIGGSQKFSLINSKHMCFYSKYTMNCMGQNVMNNKKAIDNQKPEIKNTSIVTKTNIKQDAMTSNKDNYLEFIPKSSCRGIPILPLNTKMLTFQEIYDYNHRKNVEIEDKKNKLNESSDNLKQEDKNTNLYDQSGSELNISNSFSVKENSIVKIEPEVLHYIKKLDTLSSNNGFTMLSNNTNILEKNTNEEFFIKETIQEKSLCSNNPNEHFNYNIKNGIDHNRDEGIKTGNLLKEISYSTDIKLLNKKTADLSDVIKECRKATFEYLTKVIKKHKMDTKNQSSLASSNINEKLEKSDEFFASKNHKDMENFKKFSPQLSKLASLNSKTIADNKEKDISKNKCNFMTMTNFESKEILKASNNNNLICNHINSETSEISKDDLELNMTSPNLKTVSLNKNMEGGYKSGINSNKNVKEQEKQFFHRRNNEDTLSQIQNEECDIADETNQITSSNKKLKANNMVKIVGGPIQNESVSLVNTESMNKKSPHNNHVQKSKTEPGSKIKLTAGVNNVKSAENSFEGICLETEDLKKSKNIIKTSTNTQNYNSNIARKNKHLDSDNSRICNNSTDAVCKVQAVLNKKYTSRIHNTRINLETQPNILLRRDEAKNLTKTLNSQKGSRNLDKMTEKNIINEVTVEKQKEVEKMNISEVMKPITTDYKKNDHITNMNTKVDVNVIEGNKQVKNDIKTIINKTINTNNSNESYATESIPTGLRCIRQCKIEADKDKVMEKCYLKNPFCAAESVKLKGRERKCFKSPLRKEIGKSVTLAKPTVIADCGSNSKLNQYLLKHKKQLETITNDKRVKSIKNKLSNNLRPKDGNKIISRQSHTLMSFINAESGKKKSEDNKRDTKKGKEDGLHSQKNSINKIISIPESKEQKGSERNKIGKAPESGHFYNSNFFFDSKSNPIKMSTEVKNPFNTIWSENNMKQNNEYKDDWFSKVENKVLNFSQQEINVKNKKKKEVNKIGSTISFHSFKKNMKTNQAKKHRENPIYILKTKPKVEGFISQSLRSSNSEKSHSSKIYTTVKKRQHGHLMKNKIKAELKQSATNLKKKISKHRILKTDPRFKHDQKKNQGNLKLAQSGKIFPQKVFPLHVYQQEQTKLHKNHLLDTPSRQVCGLTLPRRTPEEKPLAPKAKVTTKLIACTRHKDNVHKKNSKAENNVKNHTKDIFFISKIHNMKPEKEYKPALAEMCQMEKGKTNAQNLQEYQYEESKAGVSKDESKDKNTREGNKDSISGIELIIEQTKPANKLVEKVPDGNDISNCKLITSSKGDIDLPSIVGNVVNNVKTRIQNFLLADIAKSKLNRRVITKKKRKQEIDDLQEKSSVTKTPKKIYREKNGFEKLNQNTKQILYSTAASYAIGTTNQVQPNKKSDKRMIKSQNNNKDTSQKRITISDFLEFKPVRNKQTCPQMSYSEVLNKFYAGCET